MPGRWKWPATPACASNRVSNASRSVEESAVADFGAALRKLEGRLEGRQWLVGDEMTAADITCAAVIYRIRSSGVLPWPAGVPRTEELAHRLMALLG